MFFKVVYCVSVVHGGREDQYLPRARQQHHKCRIAKHRPCQQDQIIDIVKKIRNGKAQKNIFFEESPKSAKLPSQPLNLGLKNKLLAGKGGLLRQ